MIGSHDDSEVALIIHISKQAAVNVIVLLPCDRLLASTLKPRDLDERVRGDL